MKKEDGLTTKNGMPISNDQASLSTGENSGYTLYNDTQLFEKLGSFTRERIPERIVHAKGSGAYGYFEVTNDISKYTCAKFLSKVGKKTDLFVRFSTVGGEQGSADTARDPRGFAVKMYTEDGNYDMVGNNIPIFFIRDAMKFMDFVHTQKRHPHTGRKDDTTMFWDFLSLTPESLHQTTFLFTDRGTPRGYQHVHGFSSHAYMFYNKKGEHYWFKWHFITDQGIQNFDAQQATEMAGKNPDHDRQMLYNAIEKGDFPSWTVYAQIMTPEEAKNYRFNPFDVTKVWFHEDYPLIEVGKMVLNRNPENFFAEVEQAAFAPSSIVPGIYFSPDKLLQGRLFAYEDAQRYRLGVNNKSIPVNQPKNSPHYNNQRDGAMMVDGNYGATDNYFPNSVNGHMENKKVPEVPLNIIEEARMIRHEPQITDDDFFQTGEFWRRVLSDEQKEHLVGNIVGHLGHAKPRVQYRQTALFYRAEPEYGKAVSKGLGLDIGKVKDLSAMSKEERAAATEKDSQVPKPKKVIKPGDSDLVEKMDKSGKTNDSNPKGVKSSALPKEKAKPKKN